MAKKKAGGINKMDAMRAALKELGNDALPVALQAHLQAKGIEMNTGTISTYKGTILREGKKTGKKKMGRPPKAAASAPATVSSNGKGSGISLDDIKQVKALAERIGSTKLKELAEVLA